MTKWRKWIKETMVITWAYARCHWYLMFHGMWKGECQFEGWDQNNKLIVIAAFKGSIFKDGAITKVFYNRVDVVGSDLPDLQAQRQ